MSRVRDNMRFKTYISPDRTAIQKIHNIPAATERKINIKKQRSPKLLTFLKTRIAAPTASSKIKRSIIMGMLTHQYRYGITPPRRTPSG